MGSGKARAAERVVVMTTDNAALAMAALAFFSMLALVTLLVSL
jgi:hypothetical protein